MPISKSGKYANSIQRAMNIDKGTPAPAPAPKPMAMGMGAPVGEKMPHSTDTIETLREAFNAFLDEEQGETHPPETIEALRDAWNQFCDEESKESV